MVKRKPQRWWYSLGRDTEREKLPMPKKRTATVACTCANCGATFETWPSYIRKGGGKFCQHACSVLFRTRPLVERFWTFVRKSEGCWEWQGATSHGYGEIRGSGKPVHAHRASWEIHNGPIPAGLHVLHACDNPPCTNPAHLFLGTNADNVADKVAKGRQPRGERGSRAKLSDRQVAEIHARWASGHVQQKSLAAEFGVSASTICTILSGKTRTHA